MSVLSPLVKVLREIDESDLSEEDDQIILKDTDHEVIRLVTKYADCLLIDENGCPFFSRMDELQTHGFFVFPGERDRFGWLTGCIQTKKGIVMFG